MIRILYPQPNPSPVSETVQAPNSSIVESRIAVNSSIKGTGNWSVKVSLLEACGVAAPDCSNDLDLGNEWTLVITVRYFVPEVTMLDGG